jgi:hypothetical protein
MDGQRLSLGEAAHILGVLPWQAERILGAGPYTLEGVDLAAMEHYQPLAHREDGYSYWLTSGQAAKVMGISVARLHQLAAADLVPYLVHRSGVRLMRRHQVEVIANARGVVVEDLSSGVVHARSLHHPSRHRQDV